MKKSYIFSQLILIGCLTFNSAVYAERTNVIQHDKVAKGDTTLSPFFSIELVGGNWFSPLVLKVYHHDNGDKQAIGLTKFSEFASRQNAYAISDDGKTLLYFHQNLPNDGGINKPGGLYEFRHGRGAKRLHSFVNNAVYLPIKLPRNIIVFAQLEKIKNSMRLDSKNYLRDTEGREKPWQP